MTNSKTPQICATCAHFSIKCPVSRDVDGWDYCTAHRKWFKDQTGYQSGRSKIPSARTCDRWELNEEYTQHTEAAA